MRNMSFSLTTEQYRRGLKTETLRRGWKFLKPGDRFMGVEKAMGLKKGEKLQRMHAAECISNVPTPMDLEHITPENVKAEGFPNLSPEAFLEFLKEELGVTPGEVLNRITFKHIFEEE